MRKNPALRLAGALLALLLTIASTSAQDETLAVYVPAQDGTRLAVDVHLPNERGDDGRVPAVLELTRYWRATANPRTGERIPLSSPLDLALLARGYAVVKVDVRGTGASFGSRQSEYGRAEVRDGYALVDWVVAQPWSDGAVGAYGTSYSGTTAELLAAVQHPAVKAVIPGWSDFDLYESPARPYGLYAASLIDTWGRLVGGLDENRAPQGGASVLPVDADADRSLLSAAVAEHASNVDVGEAGRSIAYRDEPWSDDGDSYAECSSRFWKDAIERSGVPMLVFASWYDAGTAGGALERLRDYSNPQKLVILASNHGGAFNASPFSSGRPTPTAQEQIELRIDFFDRYLCGARNGVDDWPTVRYFHLGQEELLESAVWPPHGTERRSYSFGEDGRLVAGSTPSPEGGDAYAVDFGVTTGRANRWATQLGGPVRGLDRREGMDARMLTYTSEPLEHDLDVSGTPSVRLFVTSSTTDGAFLVYLEDVDASGQSRYVTEGGLRALHRAVGANGKRTFARADASTLVAGETVELVFELWPVSARFAAGHRIRVAIAGADADTFTRIPASGAHEFTLWREAERPSGIELPVVAAER